MVKHEQPEELADFPVVTTLPVLWNDQDAFGHVNNTIFIRWFESARIRYLEETGMEAMMDGIGTGPILAAISCNYRRQLKYPDTVRIGARITRLGRSSMTIEHAIHSESQDAIVADGTSTVVMFDYETNRPKRMPPELRAIVERVEGKSLDG